MIANHQPCIYTSTSINAGIVSGISQKDVCSWLEWGCKPTVGKRKRAISRMQKKAKKPLMTYFIQLVIRLLLEKNLISILICLSWSPITMKNIANYWMLKISNMKNFGLMILTKMCLILSTEYTVGWKKLHRNHQGVQDVAAVVRDQAVQGHQQAINLVAVPDHQLSWSYSRRRQGLQS